MGWSESISLTSRIFTRSPSVNCQSIAALAAPVARLSVLTHVQYLMGLLSWSVTCSARMWARYASGVKIRWSRPA